MPVFALPPPPVVPRVSFDPPTQPKTFDPPTEPRTKLRSTDRNHSPISIRRLRNPRPPPSEPGEEDRVTPDSTVNGAAARGLLDGPAVRVAPPPPSARPPFSSSPEIETSTHLLGTSDDLADVDVSVAGEDESAVTAGLPDDGTDALDRISVDAVVEEKPVLAATPPAEDALKESERTLTRKPPPPPKRSRMPSAPAPAEAASEPSPELPKFELPSSKPRAKPWWEELFTDDFGRGILPTSAGQVRREVDFIEESLAVAKGGVVLDLACGAGHHATELAGRGYGVVGFDLSFPQLAVAGELAQERSQKINFLQGDMREMAFEEMFDGIFCWNTSFGYFEDEKNVAVAQRVFKALRPGGNFLLDVVNRDFVVAHQPSQVWFEGDSCVCMDDMSVDFITSRLRVKRTMMLDDGRTRECAFSIRIYSLHELGKMLHEIGFPRHRGERTPRVPGRLLRRDVPARFVSRAVTVSRGEDHLRLRFEEGPSRSLSATSRSRVDSTRRPLLVASTGAAAGAVKRVVHRRGFERGERRRPVQREVLDVISNEQAAVGEHLLSRDLGP